MVTTNEQLINDTKIYIQDFFAKNIPAKYVFHDLEHTVQTVAAAKSLADGFQLNDSDRLKLELATWFHDTGYGEGPEGHEERSCIYAENFLKEKVLLEDLAAIKGCIRATKVPQKPQNLLEQIIADADLSHLGMDTYWERNGKFREELIVARGTILPEKEWIDFEIEFMLAHEYHTQVAKDMFNKKKAKHIRQLLKQKKRLHPDKPLTAKELALLSDKDQPADVKTLLQSSENDLKLGRMGRGVETMYRTTYRTHTNLSAMADNKANLMLSVNAIVISIIVSQLLPQLRTQFDLQLLIPTLLLLATSLGSMIFATLATRPIITEGRVTKEAIEKRKANLLFFGNFFNMKLEEFQWGVTEMLKDPEFLYSSMSRDLYFLGIVLAKKYKYLSICYGIFMYGLIISVLAFAIAFMF